MLEPEPLYMPHELCKRLRINRSTLARWRNAAIERHEACRVDPKLAPDPFFAAVVRLPSGHYRYRVGVIEELMEKGWSR
jgi:hypothetical protein